MEQDISAAGAAGEDDASSAKHPQAVQRWTSTEARDHARALNGNIYGNVTYAGDVINRESDFTFVDYEADH